MFFAAHVRHRSDLAVFAVRHVGPTSKLRHLSAAMPAGAADPPKRPPKSEGRVNRNEREQHPFTLCITPTEKPSAWE
jgi:hypothetical protein